MLKNLSIKLYNTIKTKINDIKSKQKKDKKDNKKKETNEVKEDGLVVDFETMTKKERKNSKPFNNLKCPSWN